METYRIVLYCLMSMAMFVSTSSILKNAMIMKDMANSFFLWEQANIVNGILASELEETSQKRKRHIVLLNNFKNKETISLIQSIIAMMDKSQIEEKEKITFDMSANIKNTRSTAMVSTTSNIKSQNQITKNNPKERIAGAFSMEQISGIIGEFTDDELSFLSSQEAVQMIEEDSIAELASFKGSFFNNEAMGAEGTVAFEKGCIFGTQQNPPSWGLSALSNSKSLMMGSGLQPYKYPIGRGKGVRVYVIDTGIDATLPDFGSRILDGWSIFDTSESSTNPLDSSIVDEHGHGTHVAGIIGGKLTGVAKEANLVSVRVFREGTGPVSNVIAGLAWIISQKKPGLELVNLSITSSRSLILNAMLESAWKAGFLVVTAAGNQGINACSISPAASAPWILSVGAYCENRKIAPFSNRGEKCVHIFAPGCNIVSLVPNNQNELLALNGTSMAAPHATGLAALLLSTSWIKEKLKSPENLKKIIVDELPFLIEDEKGIANLKALSMQYLYKFCPQGGN